MIKRERDAGFDGEREREDDEKEGKQESEESIIDEFIHKEYNCMTFVTFLVRDPCV